MKKAIILVLFTIGTIAFIYAHIHYIGMQGFSFAFSLNLMLMACVNTFTETLKRQLSSHYYIERAWERRGQVYESLGINFYRKLLVGIGWERIIKKSNPVEKNTKTLINLHYRTKQNELGHVIVLIIVLGFNIFVAFKFGILKSLWLLVLNLMLNLYPVLLQRYNRPRIERVISLSKQR